MHMKTILLFFLLLLATFDVYAQNYYQKYLSGKVYKSMRKAKKNHLEVEILDLSNKGLTAIPRRVFTLENLKVLILDRNVIKEIPVDILNLKQLRYLSITNNKLTKLPNEISKLENLEHLNIILNQITEIPEEFIELKKLRIFVVVMNPIKQNLNFLKENMPNCRIIDDLQ